MTRAPWRRKIWTPARKVVLGALAVLICVAVVAYVLTIPPVGVRDLRITDGGCPNLYTGLGRAYSTYAFILYNNAGIAYNVTVAFYLQNSQNPSTTPLSSNQYLAPAHSSVGYNVTLGVCPNMSPIEARVLGYLPA